MKLGLVVIDMQKCFLSEYLDTRAISDCCEYINYAGELLRKAGHIVIHVKDIEDAGEASGPELEFIDKIKIDSSDLNLEKVHSSAFWETGLGNLIQENSIDLLILCGQVAEHCVVFTYNGAQERGHTVVVLQNGVLSRKPGRVAALLEDRNTISYPVIDALASVGQQE